MLAQVESRVRSVSKQVSDRRCSYYTDRLWNGSIDFHEVLSKEGLYEDTAFTPKNALYNKEARYATTLDATYETVKWKRLTELFPDKQASMWGDVVDMQDLNQGQLGNCWFISALASVAAVPKRIHNLFLTDFSNDQGIYAARMYALGAPVTVSVDDRIPVTKENGSSSYETIFVKVPDNDSSTWGTMAEKIAAKYYGNYEHMKIGDPMDAVTAVTGAPGKALWHAEYDADELWEQLKEATSKKHVITCATDGDEDNEKSDVNLAQGHAYSLVNIHELSNGVKLIKIRNPWGTETYNGPWSDTSDKWTQELREEVGHTNPGDGFFYIDINSYVEHLGVTIINRDTFNKKLSYFLVKDDVHKNNSDMNEHFGNNEATMHKVKITS